MGGWIGKRQAYDFTFDIVRRLGCPEAVFSAYLNFQMGDLGPIADAMRSCKTVKEAFEVAARLGSMAYEGNEYFLEIDGETTWFCYREPTIVSAGQTFINDMTLAVYCQIIRATADEQWRPLRFRTKRRDPRPSSQRGTLRRLPDQHSCWIDRFGVSHGVSQPPHALATRQLQF